ncbi:MAG: hypothetical protein M1813_002925 [Trichoglossum hirsutum]|nr:MAG: hypothetical protein M1813_002925 [Trichoglossum hirsutum]
MDWDFELLLDQIDYNPQKNNFLDIWHRKGVTELDIQEGDLNNENLDEYLTAEIPRTEHDRELVGSLRLIYSWVDSESDDSDKTIFWSRSDFVKILESFRLPKRFTQMMGRCHCFFTQCMPDESNTQAERFSYIFSTMFHHCPFWCVAASWDPERNITYAFMHCTSEPDRGSIPRIKRFLTGVAPRVMHPILLPLLIMDMETDLTLGDDEDWTLEINKIENETRQAPRVAQAVDPLDLDLPSIVQRLNGCSVFLSLIERESEAVLLHLDQARGMILSLESDLPGHKKSTDMLIRYIDFMINSRKNLFLRLQNLQRRSQTQLAFTYNFLAQRDNKLNIEVARDSKVLALASSRDSTAMKSVAILTIAFLPGTFVASFLAMPLFNWQAQSSGKIIGNYFWVYWAFTIPLTGIVLGCWVVWIRIVLRKHEKEDTEVRSRTLRGLVSGATALAG